MNVFLNAVWKIRIVPGLDECGPDELPDVAPRSYWRSDSQTPITKDTR